MERDEKGRIVVEMHTTVQRTATIDPVTGEVEFGPMTYSDWDPGSDGHCWTGDKWVGEGGLYDELIEAHADADTAGVAASEAYMADWPEL